MAIEFDGRRIETDAQGYLRDLDDWSPALAEELARRDGIALTPAHWEVIELMREHYAEYRLSPPMRLLTRALAARHGAEKGSSRYLYRLFPDGPVRQASRYGGLPRPVSCI